MHNVPDFRPKIRRSFYQPPFAKNVKRMQTSLPLNSKKLWKQQKEPVWNVAKERQTRKNGKSHVYFGFNSTFFAVCVFRIDRTRLPPRACIFECGIALSRFFFSQNDKNFSFLVAFVWLYRLHDTNLFLYCNIERERKKSPTPRADMCGCTRECSFYYILYKVLQLSSVLLWH